MTPTILTAEGTYFNFSDQPDNGDAALHGARFEQSAADLEPVPVCPQGGDDFGHACWSITASLAWRSAFPARS